MPFHFKGKTFPQIPIADMTPSEIDHVERLTGLSYAKLERLARTCVCDHLVQGHLHFDGDKPTDDLSCKSEGCTCATFASDQPIRATYAYLWVALKRIDSTATFADIENTPQSEWRYEAAVDPTPPPPPSETE